MTTESRPLSYIRKCIYTTYANFPTGGLKPGDMAYATDRLVLYRWDGAAWDAMTIHSSSGAAADIPTAADLPNGSLYYETDTTLLKQVQAGAWAVIVSALVIAETSVFNANSPAAWTDLDLSAVVGSNKALVTLKIKNNSGDASTSTYQARPNGDTDSPNFGMTTSNNGLVSDGAVVFVQVYTDAAGIIEWQAGGAAAGKSAQVWVEAWMAA